MGMWWDQAREQMLHGCEVWESPPSSSTAILGALEPMCRSSLQGCPQSCSLLQINKQSCSDWTLGHIDPLVPLGKLGRHCFLQVDVALPAAWLGKWMDMGVSWTRHVLSEQPTQPNTEALVPYASVYPSPYSLNNTTLNEYVGHIYRTPKQSLFGENSAINRWLSL